MIIPASLSATPETAPRPRDTPELLSIIVPVYNEVRTVRAVLDRLVSIDLPLAREILVVDDGSTDGTGDLLSAAEREGLPVTVIRCERNGGKGHALRTGQALGDDRKALRKVPREFHADALGEDVVRADAILPLINGRRTLKAVLRSSIYPIFSTLRAVHTLRTAGYVEVVLPSDTLSMIVS